MTVEMFTGESAGVAIASYNHNSLADTASKLAHYAMSNMHLDEIIFKDDKAHNVNIAARAGFVAPAMLAFSEAAHAGMQAVAGVIANGVNINGR